MGRCRNSRSTAHPGGGERGGGGGVAGACPAGEEQLGAETLACQAPGICWLFPWRGCKRNRSTCPLIPLEVVEEGQELLQRWRSSYLQQLWAACGRRFRSCSGGGGAATRGGLQGEGQDLI